MQALLLSFAEKQAAYLRKYAIKKRIT